MSGKHTPGPWTVPHFALSGHPCNCAYVLADGYTGDIATVRRDEAKGADDLAHYPAGDEAKANARLIAAAPTMVEYIARRAMEGDIEAARILEAINVSA